jgi:DNA primase
MKFEGLDFPEAIEKLAARCGVRIEPVEFERSPQQAERKALAAALEFARDFYHGLLLGEGSASAARRYLEGRGLKGETLQGFKLGFAPGSGALVAAAARKGFGPELLARAGLAVQPEGRSTYRDYFWGRVVFPILNARGETAGFGARILGEGEPKYLNSPETPLFSKGRVLYGFFEGSVRIRKERRVVLMEGYMDVLAAHQAGHTTACAPLGTALTEDHAAQIRRCADEAAIVFDPDAAGASAALRGAQMLMERGLRVRVATVPDGLDPDELIRRDGPRALEKCIQGGSDLAEFRLALALGGRPAKSLGPEEKAGVAAGVLEAIRRCPDAVLLREWVRRLAERLDTAEEPLLLELRKGLRRGGRRPVPAEETAARPAEIPDAEREMLLCILRSPGLAGPGGLVTEHDFSDPAARAMFCALRRAPAPGRVLDLLSGGERAAASALLCDEREIRDPARHMASIVGRRRKERRLREIEPVVLGMAAGEPGDPDLRDEYVRLSEELRGMKGGV